LALLMGTIMTAAIVTLVFYFVITPIGLVRALLRSNSDYKKTSDRDTHTYWVDRKEPFDPKSMEKMY
jgi:multisubunit Na+/H+ antiporter MnhG subunit